MEEETIQIIYIQEEINFDNFLNRNFVLCVCVSVSLFCDRVFRLTQADYDPPALASLKGGFQACATKPDLVLFFLKDFKCIF